MSNVEQTITISIDEFSKDELVECIKYLRILARNYPQHLSIAYEALEKEYQLPPMMELTK